MGAGFFAQELFFCGEIFLPPERAAIKEMPQISGADCWRKEESE